MAHRWQMLLILLVSALIFCSVTLYIASGWGYDFSRFIHAGDVFVDPARVPSGINILADSFGYDGQFYYRMAMAPFSVDGTRYGISFDVPALRNQRIIYPLLVYFFSGGKPELVPVSMVIVNLIALLGIALAGSYWSRALGRSPYWGLIFVLYPGFLFSLTRDLTEIVAIFFSISALYFISGRKYLLAFFLLTFGLLTRETALIFYAGAYAALLADYHEKKTVSARLLLFALAPLAIFVLWQLRLRQIWDGLPLLVDASHNFISLPLSGALTGLSIWSREVSYNYIGAGFVFMICLAGIVSTRRSSAYNFVKYSWLLAFGLFIFWAPTLWSEDITFFRAFSEMFILSTSLVMGNRSLTARYVYPAIVIAMWLFVLMTRLVMR